MSTVLSIHTHTHTHITIHAKTHTHQSSIYTVPLVTLFLPIHHTPTLYIYACGQYSAKMVSKIPPLSEKYYCEFT